MFNTDSIEGISKLSEMLPPDMQYWHKFGLISDLKYNVEKDDLDGSVSNISMILKSSEKPNYCIHILFSNVCGKISFDLKRGFVAGCLAIDDYSGFGYERNHRYKIYSTEQDLDFEFYCERISVTPG